MKVIAYYIVHYGKDYLRWSMQSIYDSVDEIAIFYTDEPSHGTGTSLVNPDTREQLKMEVYDPLNKVTWIEGKWNNEGEHRDWARNFCRDKGYDVCVPMDTDEIWKEDILRELIRQVYVNKAGQYLCWMRHLWRSFNWICDDAMRQWNQIQLGGFLPGDIRNASFLQMFADLQTNNCQRLSLAPPFHWP